MHFEVAPPGDGTKPTVVGFSSGARARLCVPFILRRRRAEALSLIPVMASDFSNVPESALARLGHQLYQRALVRRDQEPITDPRGQPIGWLLDTRIPMLEGEIFDEIGEVLAERLQARGIHQVAGFGYGSFPIVCSVLGA